MADSDLRTIRPDIDPAVLVDFCRAHHADLAGLTEAMLVPLPRKGTSNDHVRLGTLKTERGGLVARIPRFSHVGRDRRENLANQVMGFRRAGASGHTPQLHHLVPIVPGVPTGALVVDLIEGRAPRLPDDMPALAEAFAALHAVPVPPAEKRQLATVTDPVAATRAAIEAHAPCFDAAALSAAARAMLDEELAWARSFVAAGLPALPPRFVVSDAHPGNFLIDDSGKAWFTDLEKAHWGAVPIDLAHASLPTSTGWDPDVTGSLSDADIVAFHAAWRRHADPDLAAACAPWWRPLRRLTWLRTMSFMARWQTDWADNPATGSRDAAMDRHIDAHIARCFAAETIAATRRQWLGPEALDLAG